MRRRFHAAVPLCVLASALWSAAVSGQPRPWEPRKKPQAVRALCVVRDSGKVDCVRLEDVRRTLSPDLMEKIDQMVRDILEDLGLDTSKNALFGCRGEWTVTNVSLPAATKPARGAAGMVAAPQTFPALPDAQSMLSQCRQSLRAEIDVGLRVAGMGRSAMVRETVERMDQAVAACREFTSPIAAGSSQWAVDLNQARNDYASAYDAVIEKYPSGAVIAKDPAAVAAYAGLKGADVVKKAIDNELNRIAASPKEAGKNREERRSILIEMLQQLAKEVQELVDNPIPPDPVPTNPATVPAPTPAPAPTKPPSSTGTPCDPEEGCKASCAEIQQRWDMFKEYCEQSNWQAYQCEAFLRTANRCVDMRLINPGPEGDMTCPSRAKVDKMKESYLAACRKRKWIMIPSGDRDVVCTAPDFEGIRPGVDPCNNPRVLPDPDSCFGGRGGGVPPERERTPPRPQIPG